MIGRVFVRGLSKCTKEFKLDVMKCQFGKKYTNIGNPETLDHVLSRPELYKQLNSMDVFVVKGNDTIKSLLQKLR